MDSTGMALVGPCRRAAVKPRGAIMDRNTVVEALPSWLRGASEAWPVAALFAWSFSVTDGTKLLVRLKAHLDGLPTAACLEDLSCAETDVAAHTWTDVAFSLEVELVLWGLPPNALGDGVVAIREQQRPAPGSGPPYRIDWERQSRYLPPGHSKRRP
jgi:hypothetical protein